VGIIVWIVLGLVAGMLARAILPGHDAIGIFATLAIGVAGALIGGFVAELIGFGGLGTFFELRTWIIAIAGSVLLLAIVRSVTSGRGPGHPVST
jgi:uncharacterized membrane protein YeaQ/YmgE (transglycosylase-associated protein family)